MNNAGVGGETDYMTTDLNIENTKILTFVAYFRVLKNLYTIRVIYKRTETN